MRWLIGALAIASAMMSLSLLPIIRLQITDRTQHWYSNTALRLSSAMLIHSVGGVILFAAMLSPGFKVGSEGVALYALTFAYAMWLVSKSLIVSVGSGLRWYIVLLTIWTIVSAHEGWL